MTDKKIDFAKYNMVEVDGVIAMPESASDYFEGHGALRGIWDAPTPWVQDGIHVVLNFLPCKGEVGIPFLVGLAEWINLNDHFEWSVWKASDDVIQTLLELSPAMSVLDSALIPYVPRSARKFVRRDTSAEA